MDHFSLERIHEFTIKRRRKKSAAMITCWPLVFFLATACLKPGAQAQCFGGVETYEKTAGVNFANTVSVHGLLSQPGAPITRDCTGYCRQMTNCSAFIVDYATPRCQYVDSDQIEKREHLKDSPGVNYFEKICLRRVSNFNALCGDRQWAFDRIIGATLQGFDDSEETGVQSRADCQRLCLEQSAFVCRSAEYDEASQTCRMSREDRRTQPTAFRKDGGSWDYLENQCVRTLPDCRYTARTEGGVSVLMDQVEFAQSRGECESLCDQLRAFTCRSYSFTAAENRCYLSGDDSVSHSVSQAESSMSIKRNVTVTAEKICSVSHCENGVFTFEKVTGHFLRSARQEMLSRSRISGSSSSSRIITSSSDSSGGGITVECGRICLEMGADCPAYSVDYTQGRCYKLDRNSQGRAPELTIREGMSYFEKVCLRGNVGPCRDRAWAFERHPSKELRGGGPDDEHRTIQLVATRRDCQEACLRETRFVCRSARYDTMTLDCKLSSTDRRHTSRPDAFVDAPSQVEYLENQCVGLGGAMCSYETLSDMYPRYLDSLVENVSDESQCQQMCTSNRPFSCRAYSFYASGSQCFISSDDRASAGTSALLSRPGTNYTERACGSKKEDARNESNPSGGSVFSGGGGFGMLDRPVMLNKPDTSPVIEVTNVTPFKYPDAFDRMPNKNVQGMGNADRIQPTGNRCRYGRLHYQKVGGYEAVTSRFMSLRPASADAVSHPGILVDCLNKCSGESLCSGINFSASKQSCVGIESDDDPSALLFIQPRTNQSDNFLLRQSASVAYFESQCMQASVCDSVWTTERTPGFFMRAAEREVVRGVSRIKCAERCLEERRFVCRSASYDTSRKECHLSTEDRYSRPRSFQSNPIFDYIENQCVSQSELRQCRYGSVQSDRFLLYADRMVASGSSDADATAQACRAACDSERNFRCRSYSLHSPSPSAPVQCSLSSSSSPSYEFQRGALSFERDCTAASNNEIPVQQFETAQLGSNTLIGGPVSAAVAGTADRNYRILAGTSQGNIPAADPGGWVSLASLSRTQVAAGGYKSPFGMNYNPVSRPGFTSGSDGFGYNPINSRPSSGSDGFNRRPPDATFYDSGHQFNTVSSRPFSPSLNPSTDPFSSGTMDNVLRCRGFLTYDKVANVDFVGARRQEIRLSYDGSPTLECLRECDRMRERCLSVVISTDRSTSSIPLDYRYGNFSAAVPRLRCFILDRSAALDSSSLPHTPNSMYYEKTCLSEASCGKAWTFVRVQGYELEGFDSHISRNVASKEECQSACLRMPNSQCRSAEWIPRERICRMSADNRRTQPRSFRAATPDTVYLENQCAGDPPHCEYTDQVGRMSPWYDRSVSIASLDPDSPSAAVNDCRRMCDSERDFLCKSVSVQTGRTRSSAVCLLSADDSVSLNGPNGVNSALLPERDFTYSERSSCNNVRVECTKTDMLVTLAFGYPFNGRVYVNGNYQSCFEVGNGQSQMVMRIPLVGSCGTVQQNRGRYVNNIVVQHNSLIMQDSDSSVRVECAFEASEQTISYSPGGRRDGSDYMGAGSIDVTAPAVRQMGHSVVTNTAPTPALRMRIISRNGQESRIVGLGEPLTLRIEIDATSAFGITARSVEARTENGEVLQLIDATGCPRDINIFPPLELDPHTKSLSAEFKAFRFPSTATVHFVATVGFCQERCEPARCADGWDSYGRRKRQVDTTTGTLTETTVGTTPEEPGPTTHPSTTDVLSTTVELGMAGHQSDAVEPLTTLTATSADQSGAVDGSSTMVELTTESSQQEEESVNNIIPVEVPLHLQLIVMGEVDRSSTALPPPLPSKSAAYSDLPRRSEQALPSWRSPSFIHPNDDARKTGELDACASKSTVVAVSVVAALLHVVLLIAFYVFYRNKKASWMKLAHPGQKDNNTEPLYGLRHSGSASEVTFRSVYGLKNGPAGTLSRAFNVNSMSENPRGPHIASVFIPSDT